MTEDKRARVPALLKMLADNGHETPFEKSTLHFLVCTDIASHIHLLKHRIGVSINAESARYKEIKGDNVFIPEDFPKQWAFELEEHTKDGIGLYHNCINSLVKEYGFTRARAKESARFFRGYNTQITSDITFNWRSFVHFQRLRNKPNAQVEIRDIADNMLALVKNLPNKDFQESIAAFNL